MVAKAPQTTAKSLSDKINSLIQTFEYVSPDSLVIRQLMAEAQQLMNSDPNNANLCKANIYFLIGDFEKVKYHIGLTNKLPADSKQTIFSNSTIVLSNCSFYSEALEYYYKIDAHGGLAPFEITGAGLNSLALIKLDKLIKEAMKFELSFEDKDIELASRASEILASANLTDQDVARYADVFGEVLRENKVLIENHPTVYIGDDKNYWHPHTVFIVFKINADVKTAADLYEESVFRVIEKLGAFPEALHMSVEAA